MQNDYEKQIYQLEEEKKVAMEKNYQSRNKVIECENVNLFFYLGNLKTRERNSRSKRQGPSEQYETPYALKIPFLQNRNRPTSQRQSNPSQSPQPQHVQKLQRNDPQAQIR